MLTHLLLSSAEFATRVSKEGIAGRTPDLLSVWLCRMLVAFSQGPVSQPLSVGVQALAVLVSSATSSDERPVLLGRNFPVL